MDNIMQALKDAGYENPEDALAALQALKAADEGAKDQNTEKFEKAISDMVAGQVKAQMDAVESQRKIDFEKIAEGEPNETDVTRLKIDMWLLSAMLRKQPSQINPQAVQKAYSDHQLLDFSLASIRKALDTTGEPAIIDKRAESVLLRDVEKASGVFENLRILDMPVNPWEPPYQSSNISLYGVDENTADAGDVVGASDPATNKITFFARKIGARALWSRELDEDSAVAILPMIREDFIRATRNGWEYNMLMGDENTANTNINKVGVAPTTTAGAKDAFLQTDGMVKHCIVTNTGQASGVGAAMDKAKWVVIMAKLGKYGDARGDLVAFCNRSLLFDMLQLDQVITLEKYGAGATVITGELGKFFGVPLVLTDGLPLSDANGKIDGSTPGNNVKKNVVMVNRAVGVMIGRRGDLRISVDEINRTDQFEGIVYSRYDIGFPYVMGLSYGYNIT